jgi:predicted Holliday junction resolvase-like endonuclease
MAILAYICIILAVAYVYSKQIVRHKQTVDAYKAQLEAYKKLVPDLGSVIPMSHYRSVVDEKNEHLDKIKFQLEQTEKELSELKSQQQSKSVRLGQISEVVLPFHQDFPYDYKKLKPLFQPIDYIYFGEKEIVFIEMKMGTSQLSESQRKIRRLIEQGNVRFEEHRVSESGYTIKETHGEKA